MKKIYLFLVVSAISLITINAIACPKMPAGILTNEDYGIKSVLTSTQSGFQIRRIFDDIDKTIYYNNLGQGRVDSNAPANKVFCKVFNGKMSYVEDFGLPFGSSGFTNYLSVTAPDGNTVVTVDYHCNGGSCQANGSKTIFK